MRTVKVAVSNRRVWLIGPYPVSLFDRIWSYSNPSWKFIKRKFPNWKWDGRERFLDVEYHTVPGGLWRATRKEIKDEHGIRFKVIRAGHEDVEPRRNLRSDREYQNECTDAMVRAVRYGGGLVLNATGTGKTRIAGLFSARVETTICFLVDQLDLLDQARMELEKTLGEEIGFVGDGIFVPRRITVATIQTLAGHVGDKKFEKWLRKIRILFIDEIHVQMNKRNFKVINKIRPLAVFGLTATLQLKQKAVRMRAFSIAGPVVYEYPLMRGMEEGILTRGKVALVQFENKIDPDDKQRYVDEYTERIAENAERNALVARLARLNYEAKRYTIILVQRVKHVKALSKRLEDIPHRLVFGEKRVEERWKARKKFEKGKVRLLIANQVFKKGIDLKRLDAIIDAAAMKSPNDAIQKFGRGVRKHESKESLWYWDIQDTDEGNKDNRFQKAGRRRARAFKKVGIQTKKFRWEVGQTRKLFKGAREWLQRKATEAASGTGEKSASHPGHRT